MFTCFAHKKRDTTIIRVLFIVVNACILSVCICLVANACIPCVAVLLDSKFVLSGQNNMVCSVDHVMLHTCFASVHVMVVKIQWGVSILLHIQLLPVMQDVVKTMETMAQSDAIMQDRVLYT